MKKRADIGNKVETKQKTDIRNKVETKQKADIRNKINTKQKADTRNRINTKQKADTKSKSNIIYSLAACVCFLLLYGTTYRDVWKEQARNGCDIVVMGDSILGQCRDMTSVPARLEELSGKQVFNSALGGTCMSRVRAQTRQEAVRDSLSITALAEAVTVQDFGVQQTIRSRESAADYYEVTIDSLCTVDFEQVEILLIGAGVNDYHAGTPIYPQEDAYDPYTYVGALRRVIRDIRRAYPNVRILLVTPTYTWYLNANVTCEEYDLGGGVLEQYVNAEMQTAEEMGVEIIDLYHDLYPHEQWEDWKTYTNDGVHPNEAGRALIAEKIAEYLKEQRL